MCTICIEFNWSVLSCSPIELVNLLAMCVYHNIVHQHRHVHVHSTSNKRIVFLVLCVVPYIRGTSVCKHFVWTCTRSMATDIALVYMYTNVVTCNVGISLLPAIEERFTAVIS